MSTSEPVCAKFVVVLVVCCASVCVFEEFIVCNANHKSELIERVRSQRGEGDRFPL